MRRLVSAIYEDYKPFNSWKLFDYFETISNPNKLEKGDTLLLWGGEDIHPALYKQGRSRWSGAARNGISWRDQIEWNLINKAKELGIPIIGVCRGAQIMCAAAGGSLWQHTYGHAGYDHDIETKEGLLEVNSLHHQMLNLNNSDGVLLAHTPHTLSRSGWYVNEHGEEIEAEIAVEPEAVWFPSLNGLAVQWHPEMMHPKEKSQAWIRDRFLEFIKDI